jgi:hypothetical protein
MKIIFTTVILNFIRQRKIIPEIGDLEKVPEIIFLYKSTAYKKREVRVLGKRVIPINHKVIFDTPEQDLSCAALVQDKSCIPFEPF